MQITVEVGEKQLSEEISKQLMRYHWIATAMETAIKREAQSQIDNLPVKDIVHDYLESKIQEILEDVVNRQIRHVVKLAVDRELAAARESTS